MKMIVDSKNKPDADAISVPEGKEGTLAGERNEEERTQYVNYLNSLLESSPQRTLDFSGIDHLSSLDDALSSNNATDSEVIYYGYEYSKTKVKELNNERNQLKLKVARLIAQLNEADFKMDSLTTENASLKSKIDDLENHINLYKIAITDTTRSDKALKKLVVAAAQKIESQVDSRPDVKKAPAVVAAGAVEKLDQEGTPLDTPQGDSAGEVFSESEAALQTQFIAPVLTPESIAYESRAPLTAPARETVATVPPFYIKPGPSQNTEEAPAAKFARDRMNATAPQIARDQPTQQEGQTRKIFYSKPVVINNDRPASATIIKKELKDPRPHQERGQDSEKVPRPHAMPAGKAEEKRNSASLPPATVAEAKEPEGEARSSRALLLGSAAADGEVSPVTKTIARKFIENYRLIQVEADSHGTASEPDLTGKA